MLATLTALENLNIAADSCVEAPLGAAPATMPALVSLQIITTNWLPDILAAASLPALKSLHMDLEAGSHPADLSCITSLTTLEDMCLDSVDLDDRSGFKLAALPRLKR